MKRLCTLALLLFAGCVLASAMGAGQTLPLDVNTQKKAVKLQEKIQGMVKKAPASRAEEEWKLVGTGNYTDDIMTNAGVPSETWEVQIYESAATPGFYRVENPYGNGNCPYFEAPFDCCDFLLHAENPDAVWMEYVEIKNVDFGLTSEDEYCPAYTGDMAGYYIGEGFFDAETAIAMGMTSGRMLGGRITFEPESLILDFPLYGDSGFTFTANNSGLFCVALPGAKDFDFSVDAGAICSESTLTFTYKAGADIAEVKYDIFPGMLSFQTQDEDLFNTVITDGKTATGGSATVAPEYGINTVAVVALEAEGNVVARKVFYYFGQQENADQWTSIGKAEYSEGVLSSIYPEEIEHTVYEVDIEESTTTPGRYRLVDLYGPSFPYYQNLLDDNNILPGHNHHHYTVVDASDPDMVVIEPSPFGADFGYGQVMMFSEGWFSMLQGADITNEDVLAGFGKLEEGKITFLGGAIFLYMPEFGMPRGNTNHKFYIKVPSKDSVSDIAVDSQAPAEYFNLQGMPVANPENGLFIRRQGGKATKVVVR